MKTLSLTRIVPTAFVAAASILAATSADAAVITWGSSTTIINDTTQIATAGFSVAGVDFSNAAGADVIINNGPGGAGGTNVTFRRLNGGGGLNGNSSVALTNGVTVTTTNWQFANSTGSMSNVTTTAPWGAILDSNIGSFSTNGRITLSGLVAGTLYQVQYFASAEDGNSFNGTTVQGSPAFGNHTGGSGRFVLGTFTADGTSQVLDVIRGGDTFEEPVASALTIGAAAVVNVIPEPATATLALLGLGGMMNRRRRMA